MTHEEKWERSYKLLVEYYKKYGDVRVPRKYIVNGVQLGQWVSKQREAYKKGILTEEHINKLNELSMFWNLNYQHSFDYYYPFLEDYYKEYGNINIPGEYEINGVKLGSWLAREKHAYKIGKERRLTEEQVDKLNKLGLTWEIINIFSFDYYYSLLKDYHKKYGNIDVPKDYIVDGVKLGLWLSNKRSAYTGHLTQKITKEEIDKLNELGMTWYFYRKNWTQNYKLLKEYYDKYGNINISDDCLFKGVPLGYWLNVQRNLYNENNSKLGKTRIFKLNSLGIDWNKENTELLNKSINNIEIYNSILNERVSYILRDLVNEGANKIHSIKKQKQIENELIKRIWR